MIKPGSIPNKKVFDKIRKQHGIEAAEDYTELVLDLIEKEGEARVCRLAKILGVSHVTAIRTVNRLCDEGYLETEPRKPIFLSKKGLRLAKNIKQKHQIVLEFLMKLGVPENVAIIDSEGIEHHLSDITLSKMQDFISR